MKAPPFFEKNKKTTEKKLSFFELIFQNFTYYDF